MAEAVLYGRLHQSIDYVDITNAIPPTEATDSLPGPETGVWAPVDGTDLLSTTIDGETVTISESSLAAAEANGFISGEGEEQVINVIRVDANGDRVTNNDGEDFSGWGVSARNWRDFTTVNPLTGIGGSVNDRANRLGGKGSEDLGNGLKAIYQIEFGLNVADGSSVSYRNSFAGLAGDWGTVLVGRHDTPLKISTGKLDLFSDTMADYNGTIGFHDVRAPTTVAYISPSFNGLSFAAASHTGGGGTVGPDNVNNDSISAAWSLALIYSNGPFYGSAAYEVFGNEMFMDSDTSLAGKNACINPDGSQTLTCDYVDDDFSKWRLGLGLLDWNGFTLTGIYEQQDDLPAGQQRMAYATVDPDGNTNIFGLSGVKEQRLWQVQAGYSFGNNMIKAMYGAVDRDADRALDAFRTNPRAISNLTDDLEGDREAWAIGFDHNFSKRTKAYALYTDVSDDISDNLEVEGAEWSGFSLGIVHKF
jgi:predicted porin